MPSGEGVLRDSAVVLYFMSEFPFESKTVLTFQNRTDYFEIQMHGNSIDDISETSVHKCV